LERERAFLVQRCNPRELWCGPQVASERGGGRKRVTKKSHTTIELRGRGGNTKAPRLLVEKLKKGPCRGERRRISVIRFGCVIFLATGKAERLRRGGKRFRSR